MDIVKEQRVRQQHRKDHGAALSVEVMGFASNVIAVEARLEDHKRRLDLLLNEIKDLCSLPRQKAIRLDTEIYLFEQDEVESYHELKQMALLNNPRIQAARLQLNIRHFLKLKQVAKRVRASALAYNMGVATTNSVNSLMNL